MNDVMTPPNRPPSWGEQNGNCLRSSGRRCLCPECRSYYDVPRDRPWAPLDDNTHHLAHWANDRTEGVGAARRAARLEDDARQKLRAITPEMAEAVLAWRDNWDKQFPGCEPNDIPLEHIMWNASEKLRAIAEVTS